MYYCKYDEFLAIIIIIAIAGIASTLKLFILLKFNQLTFILIVYSKGNAT